MPKGNSRRLIFVSILLAIAVAALVFPTINIEAANFRRGGTGPLGLRLGLDLLGGVHLVYQAERSPNEIRATYVDGTETDVEAVTAAITPVLESMGRSLESVELSGSRSFLATVPCLTATGDGVSPGLEEPDQETVRQAFESLGTVTGTIRFSGCTEPTESQMEGAVSIIERRINEFGVAEPNIQILGNERILVQLPGVGDTEIEASFQGTRRIEQVRTALAPFARGDAFIQQVDGSQFIIDAPSLYPPRRDAQGQITEPAESERIREALEEVGALASYSVSGGIEAAKRLIGQTAVLEFKHRVCQDELCILHQDVDLNLGGDDLARAFADQHQTSQLPIVSIEFSSEGADIFGDLTTRISVPNEQGYFDRIAIFLDDVELVAPVARQAILGGQAFIEGPDFTLDRVRTLAIQLESGRLPIPISVVQERDVDATLGADALRKSVIAGIIGLGIVLIFMVLYYRVPGLMAAGALVTYMTLVLAVFKLFPVTLTLAGVAGFILSIGMAVDANILIFERMKEELRTGRSLLGSIETGFSRAWPSIRDSNISTFITCGILWWFGTRLGASVVVGFAVTLFIGVALSMFSAIFVSRSLLHLTVATPLRKLTRLFTPVGIQSQGPAARPFLGGR